MTANLESFKPKKEADDAALLKDAGLRLAKEEDVKDAVEFAAAMVPGSAWQLKAASKKGILIVAVKKKKIMNSYSIILH